jgi:hypothetical protein
VLDATTLDLPSINYQVLIHLSFNQCHIPHHIHIYHIISCHSNHHSNFILFNPKQFQDYQYKVIITLLTSVFLNSITYTLSTISIIKYIQPNIINIILSSQILQPISHNTITYIFINNFHTHKYNEILSISTYHNSQFNHTHTHPTSCYPFTCNFMHISTLLYCRISIHITNLMQFFNINSSTYFIFTI